MTKIISRLSVLSLVGMFLLAGCAKEIEEPVQGIAVGEPNPSAGTSLKIDADAAKAMKLDITVDGIESIHLKDLEGLTVDRTFSLDETQRILDAFNDSYIMDTAYIEMITGYTMTMILTDGREVFITSYGDEVFIVARIDDGPTYHLGCEVIAQLLLEGNP